MTFSDNLAALGIALPAAPAPVGSYVAAVRSQGLVFTSGQLPFKDGKLIAVGKVPVEVPVELAQAAAGAALLNALAAINAVVPIDNVKQVVRLNVFVNSAAGFTDQAKVANGASDLLVKILGPAGRHTRCAIGAAELPLNAAVELDLVVEAG
jgi:enamine deaminase RidA (YjgF/YER057c/UK114 family)